MSETVRLDQWLWAARFFRTRTLAKEAIEAGHVRCDGERCKVAKSVHAGMNLTVRRGGEEFAVVVAGLSTVRGGAPQAQQLYDETPDSTARREQARLMRQAAGPSFGNERPSKKGRRMIERLKRDWGQD
ncbi:RNA-binding S4 domain-containing protein [Solimonas marina]|uniref:Heat shock protein 15 n=1 Tax=Solimonas marina TaxID=2714601 RepID=A0A969WE14_9GAMM|nr:S4 domain-containing protein [Solimonas marina]NKF23656.1 RNA-binding protein [Solimonas marina]